jgi:isoleucyl-tRNA synthetase/bisphosphoglycerate-dependent phosphoglycerate mutase
MRFDPVDPKQNFPALEEGIQKYWQMENVFQRSITMRQGGEVFGFYDGPPFATGLPHYGHLLGGTIKDVIPRFQTMRGKQVHRRFGWDCHGLPVEYEIEKEQGIKSRKDIEAMGVARFNELCRDIVQRYAKEWRVTVERMGRFVDMDHDYRTMDPDYMESIWWVFSQLAEKGLLVEGHKPMHVCPRCATPLSNFEVTQGYRDVDDIAATVAFKLKDEDAYVLAWTTTPWTLPGNLFLAVHPETSYTKVIHEGTTYILGEPLLERIFKDSPYEKIGASFKGSTLVGKTYEPLFPYFADQYPTAFRVVAGDFVTVEDGTGIVHIAPGFGEDDAAVGKREGVAILQHVGMDGHFVPAVTDFAGMEVKPKDEPTKTDKAVAAWLKERGLLFRTESYRHSYPHCWRCESPLLNYATSSWFVAVEKIKQAMIDANAKTEWVPEHLRDGRFGKWLEGARDWAISRNRYWGTPLPVWRTADKGETVMIAGRDDLMAHKPIRFTKVTAVRHGESLANVGKVFDGIAPGKELTERGKEQAAETGSFLAEQNVDVIYASPMRRAQQTAEAIAKATGARIVTDDRLIETQFGPFEGATHDSNDEKARKARRMAKIETRDLEGFWYLDGMERMAEMDARLHGFLREILPNHRSEHVVIVSHGAPLLRVRGFFTREDPYKLSVLPLQDFAEPATYFWDHDTDAQADLHKHFMDGIRWPASKASEGSVHLTVVRHGETDWNKEKKLQAGASDIPLNDTGKTQARALGKKLKGQTFDVIVTSPLKRAVETAEIIAEELGMGDVVVMEGFRERNMGAWEGQSTADLDKNYPGRHPLACIVQHPATPENAESYKDFLRRIENTCEEILAKYAGKRVLVACHRGVSATFRTIVENRTYEETVGEFLENGTAWEMTLNPFHKRIPDVLDCWFESGSMPYAQERFPYRFHSGSALKEGKKSVSVPKGFPADFIAEGIDQTRGWFYTLTVLGAALYGVSPFKHVVVNGTVLAEDGRKMSKRLKNYPEPGAIIDKHGADALRFALMSSQAVRAEDMRFSEKTVEDALRAVILPLWNSYGFFVTYASTCDYEPSGGLSKSTHPLDAWILAEMQDMTNRVTAALEGYDLSGACAILQDGLDGLTNWYIRLSRRRFAGKGPGDAPEATADQFSQDQRAALDTLNDVLLTFVRLLAPFCPFVTDAIYLNLTKQDHGSVHLTDWPEEKELGKKEKALLEKTRVLRRVVSLGMTVRSENKIKVRLPLRSATIAVPSAILDESDFTDEDRALLMQELNVKEIVFTKDPGSLGERTVSVNARMAGPRMGKKVQEVIAAGKRGEFKELPDGSIEILGETLTAEEAPLHYKGAEGRAVAAEGGVIVSLDVVIDEALTLEGDARELMRHVQQRRKDAGLSVQDRITLRVDGGEALMAAHGKAIADQTNADIGDASGETSTLELDSGTLSVTISHP